MNLGLRGPLFDPSFLPGSVETKALCGYNKALGLVFDDYRCQSLGEGFIKNRHRLLWLEIDPSYGGYYKTELYSNDRRGMGLAEKPLFLL